MSKIVFLALLLCNMTYMYTRYLYSIIAGDENKKQLLDLGAIEALLKLMQSEDRIVRRNACMAMGVMTAHRGCLYRELSACLNI